MPLPGSSAGTARVKAHRGLQDQLFLQSKINLNCYRDDTCQTGQPAATCSTTSQLACKRDIDHLAFQASLPQSWLSGSPYPYPSCDSCQKPFLANPEAACFSGHPYPASFLCLCLCHSSCPCQTPSPSSWLYPPACCPWKPCSQLYCFSCCPVGDRSFLPVLVLTVPHQPLWCHCLRQLTKLTFVLVSCFTPHM